jgi:hypothetical protein
MQKKTAMAVSFLVYVVDTSNLYIQSTIYYVLVVWHTKLTSCALGHGLRTHDG